MAEKHRTTAIYSPKSLNELISIIAKEPQIRIFAGGTSLMSAEGFYPNQDNGDIVSLEHISELSRVLHNEKYIEVGAMVTLQQFLISGLNVVSKELYKAISQIGSYVVRTRATIGGCLCTKENRYSLCGILASLGAVAEIKMINHLGKKGKRIKVVTRWIPVSKLYDANGTFMFTNDSVLTRVRIPIVSENEKCVFKSLGSPMYDRKSCVMFALKYSVAQNASFSSPSLCVSISEGGFFYNPDFNNSLTSLSVPVSVNQIRKICDSFEEMVIEECPDFSDLQVERAKRLLATVLFDANTIFLSKT